MDPHEFSGNVGQYDDHGAQERNRDNDLSHIFIRGLSIRHVLMGEIIVSDLPRGVEETS